MRACNEDRSPARVHSCDAAPTPAGFAQMVSDDFPVPFHPRSLRPNAAIALIAASLALFRGESR